VKVLALDLGEQRVGYALGDTRVGFVNRTGFVKVAELSSFLESNPADLVLVGLPVSLNGRFSHAVERTVRQIERQVAPHVKRIAMIDERYTSKMVEQRMKPQDRRRKGRIDALSAFTILEEYLRGTPKIWWYRENLALEKLKLRSIFTKILVWELPLIVECESDARNVEVFYFASHPQVFVELKRLGKKVTNREEDLVKRAPFELAICEEPLKIGLEFQEVMAVRGGIHPRERG